MIEVEKYNFKHFDTINRWLRAYGMAPLSWREVPDMGYVATYKDQLVASVFLRKIEGGYGLVDGLIGDPTADRGKRNEALDLLLAKLSVAAKDSGITKLMAFTFVPAAKNRALKHKYSSKSAYLLNLDLNK